MDELITLTYQCPTCGEENETLVDSTGGSRQTYTEDCTICCHPNVLHITIRPDDSLDCVVESEG